MATQAGNGFDARFTDLSILGQVKDVLVRLHDSSSEIYNVILKEKVKISRLSTSSSGLQNTVEDRDICLRLFNGACESLTTIIGEFRKMKKIKHVANTADGCFGNARTYFNLAISLHKEYCSRNVFTAFTDPGFGQNVELDTEEVVKGENNLDLEVYSTQINYINADVNLLFDKISSIVAECVGHRNVVAAKYRQIVGNLMVKEGNGMVNGSPVTHLTPVRKTMGKGEVLEAGTGSTTS
jgi:hypothetical protein